MKEKSSAPKRKLHLFIVIGLASSLLSFISTPVSAVPPLTCANGGPCQPGDIGPGGGKVFYSDPDGFLCGPLLENTCNYLEAATVSSSPSWSDQPQSWLTNGDLYITGTLSEIGAGYFNTLEILSQVSEDTSTAPAAFFANSYQGGALNDWYLPSLDELQALYENKDVFPDLSNFFYYSSTRPEWSKAPFQVNIANGFSAPHGSEYVGDEVNVRAIRAFAGPPFVGDLRIYRPVIRGVTAPVRGATPVETYTAGLGYDAGSITWSGPDNAPLNSDFDSATVYTASFEIIPTESYTVQGVAANFFTVSGATSVTHDANSGLITAIFPSTLQYYDGTNGVEDCGTSGTYTIVNNHVTSNSSCAGIVAIPNGVTEVNTNAFAGSAITELLIPNSVLVIRDSAFARLNSLTSLTIGTGLTTLEASSFYNLNSVLTTFRYCGYGSFNFSAAGLGDQIPPICVISRAVNGVSFEISSSLPIDDQNNVYVRLSDLDRVDSLTVSAMLGPGDLNVAAVYGGGGGCETFNLADSKECIRQNMGIETGYFDVTYQALSESNSESITVRVRSVPNLAPEISYRQPIFKGRVQPEVQIDADLPYRFLHIGFQNEVITYSETETVNGLFENDRYRIYTGETGLKVKQIWTTADADTHINFHGTAPSSGSITVTIKAGAFIASYPTYASNALVIPIDGCDGITAVCVVGDTGPGGGKIFYVESQTEGFVSAAPECASGCRYLEAAISGVFSDWLDSGPDEGEGYVWSENASTHFGITRTNIGSGYENTTEIIAEDAASISTASSIARNYRGGGKVDWYLPSLSELDQLFTKIELVGLFSSPNTYWSSSESVYDSNSPQTATTAFASSGESGQNAKDEVLFVRPIRAFAGQCYVVVNGIVTDGGGCEEVVIDDDVTAIGYNAFDGFSSITSVRIGNNVRTIGVNAFARLGNLTELTLGNNIQTIGDNAFRNAYNLESLIIPDSVEVIGYRAFRYSERLQNINFGSGLRIIGEQAFVADGYSELTALIIPNGVTEIGSRAFYGAENLVSLKLGTGLETIGDNAFAYTDSLMRYEYCGNRLTSANLVSAGLGGKERVACPRAAVQDPVPNPRQQSKVLSINPASAPELTQTFVVISGEFVETIVNILISGVELPAGAWKQTQDQVSFTIPVKKAGVYSIQLYNGSTPLLEPLSFSFTLASEIIVQTPITKPTPNPETEISKETEPTTNPPAPVASKPLQKTIVTRIYFDLGSSSINMVNSNTLEGLAKRISGLGSSIKVSVTGFAQPTPGSEKTDLALSKMRAASVAKSLRKFGVNTKVTYAGAGRALKNVPSSRYVEIVVTNR